MGKKGKWFSAVKKVFSPNSDEKKSKDKLKKKWIFGKPKASDPGPSNSIDALISDTTPPLPPPVAPPPPPAAVAPPPPPPPPPFLTPPLPLSTHDEAKEIRLVGIESEQNKHAYSVALASAVAAEAAAVAAQAAAEVVRLTAVAGTAITTTRVPPGKSKEEASAIRIQTAFRGYLARRALRALRGLVRLKDLVCGGAARRQTTGALRSMQAFTRVQSQIRSRRVRMLEENLALQRQLQLKRERELEKSKMGEDWDDSLQSKEQIEASLLYRQEAAIRRERALAYAFSHQSKNTSRAVIPMFTDPNNPQWGWTWVERWVTSRPWESRIDANRAPVLGQTQSKPQIFSRPPSRQSPSTPPAAKASLIAAKMKARSASPRAGGSHKEEDRRSIGSMHSERPRRHSIVSSIMDNMSNASTPAFPSYMQSTESTRAKSRAYSPVTDKPESYEKGAHSSAKKRLSFPVVDKPGVSSPGKARRHSGPAKVEVASVEQVADS